MQVVCAVIDRQLEPAPVEHKASCAQPVAVAPDQRAEIRRGVDVGCHRVVAKHDVGMLAIAVRGVDFGDDAAEVGDLDDQATLVA